MGGNEQILVILSPIQCTQASSLAFASLFEEKSPSSPLLPSLPFSLPPFLPPKAPSHLAVPTFWVFASYCDICLSLSSLCISLFSVYFVLIILCTHFRAHVSPRSCGKVGGGLFTKLDHTVGLSLNHPWALLTVCAVYAVGLMTLLSHW